MSKCIKYIQSDFYRVYGRKASVLKMAIKAIIGHGRGFKYMFWLRLSQHGKSMKPLAIYMHHRLSNKYCIDISRNVKIGYGLYLGHAMCIVVSPSAIIGNNVNLSQFVNIGSNKSRAATIGNNVYIAPHVSIVENVTIGDNVTIGSGAVVTKSIPENSTAVGVPAKVISTNNAGQFIMNIYNIDP